MKHTLYAYIEGSENDDLEEMLVSFFEDFIKERQWVCQNPKVVNQKKIDDPALRTDDIPAWDLGINIDLPDIGREPEGWFSDIIAIANILGELHKRTNQVFIIGIGDTETGISEDLFDVDSSNPNIEKLKTIIGVGEI